MIIFVGIKEIYFFCHCSFFVKGNVVLCHQSCFTWSCWNLFLGCLSRFCLNSKAFIHLSMDWESTILSLGILPRPLQLANHFQDCIIVETLSVLLNPDWLTACMVVAVLDSYRNSQWVCLRIISVNARWLPDCFLLLWVFLMGSGIVAQHLRKDKCNQ